MVTIHIRFQRESKTITADRISSREVITVKVDFRMFHASMLFHKIRRYKIL